MMKRFVSDKFVIGLVKQDPHKWRVDCTQIDEVPS